MRTYCTRCGKSPPSDLLPKNLNKLLSVTEAQISRSKSVMVSQVPLNTFSFLNRPVCLSFYYKQSLYDIHRQWEALQYQQLDD